MAAALLGGSGTLDSLAYFDNVAPPTWEANHTSTARANLKVSSDYVELHRTNSVYLSTLKRSLKLLGLRRQFCGNVGTVLELQILPGGGC